MNKTLSWFMCGAQAASSQPPTLSLNKKGSRKNVPQEYCAGRK
jgi:hypothetical protein